MSAPTFALTFATALGSALAAGVFFAFSTFVMSGLDRIPSAAAVAAMQSINRAAPGPPLMAVLFGTAALSIAVALVALLGNAGPHGSLAIAGAAIYLVGVIAVTMAANVPLNERLDRLDPDDPTAAARWHTYTHRWRTWNHLRTLSALTTTATTIATLAA
jgi:uncharacterized membrane protein